MQPRFIATNTIPSPAREKYSTLDFTPLLARADRLCKDKKATSLLTLAVLLAITILRHEARDRTQVRDGAVHILEGEERTAAGLGVVPRAQLVEAGALAQIIRQGDVGRQVRARVEGAGALAAVGGDEGMLVDPVGAGEGAGEAGGDAVAGGVDAVAVVEVDFGDDAGHVDALEVANAAGFAAGDHEVGE
jgi:hypothetical protein